MKRMCIVAVLLMLQIGTPTAWASVSRLDSNVQPTSQSIKLTDDLVANPRFKKLFSTKTKTLMRDNPGYKLLSGLGYIQRLNVITGTVMKFFIDEHRFVVEGGERTPVGLTIYPEKDDRAKE